MLGFAWTAQIREMWRCENKAGWRESSCERSTERKGRHIDKRGRKRFDCDLVWLSDMHGSTSVCAHPQHTYTNIHLTDTAHIAQQPDISIPFCFYMFYRTTCTTCFLFDFSMSKKNAKVFLYLLSSKVNDLSDLSEKEPGSWRHQHGHNLNSAAQEDGKKYENRTNGTNGTVGPLPNLLPRGYGGDLWWGATGADAGTQGNARNVWICLSHVCLTCLILFLNSHCKTVSNSACWT